MRGSRDLVGVGGEREREKEREREREREVLPVHVALEQRPS